jgi:UDP-N-acetylmuramoyl-L-alanyl-D-glutamate--2,6-diaminopimelate ligase
VRDKARRKVLGQMAGKAADIVIVSNEDPFDTPPMEIIVEIAQGVKEQGKVEGQDLFLIEDRRAGIAKALSLGKAGDLVLLTGKGAEQKIAVANGKYLDWDDRQVVREELAKLIFNP